MQSKTSSFNLIDRSLLKRNLTRFWPLTAVYTFFMLWIMPGVQYFDIKLSMFATHESKVSGFLYNIYYDEVRIAIWTSFIVAIVMALCVFGYLQNERSCYFYHSMPMTRTQLYTTNIASGLLMLYVPNIVAYLLTIAVAASNNISAVGDLSVWLLVISVEELFFFVFASICMLLTGNSVVATFIYIIFNFLVDVMLLPINGIYSTLYFGINEDILRLPDNILGIFSPIDFESNLSIEYDTTGIVDFNFRLENMGMVLGTYFVAAVILTVLSLIMYKRRKSENSGDIIAIKVLRPVFRYGFGICLSLLLTWLIIDSFFNYNDYSATKRIATFFTVLILAVIGYIAAEMIMMKSVRVLKNLRFKTVIFATVIAVFCIGMIMYGQSESKKIPETEDIKEVYVYLDRAGATFDDTADVELIRNMHSFVVNNYDEIVDRINYNSYGEASFSFDVKYTLKDGSVIDRSYRMPTNYKEICDKARAFTNAHVKEFIFDGHTPDDFLDCYTNYFEKAVMNNIEVDFTKEETIGLYNAILKDIEEGNLDFKTATGSVYDVFNSYAYDNDSYIKDVIEKESTYDNKKNIVFSYKSNDKYTYRHYCYIEYDSKCVNTDRFVQESRSYQDMLASFNE